MAPETRDLQPPPLRRSRLWLFKRGSRRFAGRFGVLFAILAWCAAALLALLVVVLLCRDGIIEFAVCRLGSMALGTPVELERFESSLNGRMLICKLVVRNPSGYQQPYALELGHVRVKLDLMSLLGDTIVVDEAVISGMRINYEQTRSSGNLDDLSRNFNDFTGSAGEDGEPENLFGSGGPYLFIRKITISDNILFIRDLDENTSITVPMLDLTFNDIGGYGHPVAVTLGEAYDRISTAAVNVASIWGQQMLDSSGSRTSDAFRQTGRKVVDAVKSLWQWSRPRRSGAED